LCPAGPLLRSLVRTRLRLLATPLALLARRRLGGLASGIWRPVLGRHGRPEDGRAVRGPCRDRDAARPDSDRRGAWLRRAAGACGPRADDRAARAALGETWPHRTSLPIRACCWRWRSAS